MPIYEKIQPAQVQVNVGAIVSHNERAEILKYYK